MAEKDNSQFGIIPEGHQVKITRDGTNKQGIRETVAVVLNGEGKVVSAIAKGATVISHQDREPLEKRFYLDPEIKLLNHEDIDEKKRGELIQATKVRSDGVAECTNISGETTQMAVVQIGPGGNATLLAFKLAGDDIAIMLPPKARTQIGFFIASSMTGRDLILRNGKFPGLPLQAHEVGKDTVIEVGYGLGGIRPNEVDESKWADQIGLMNLGFDPTKSRGIFKKCFRGPYRSSAWEESPLFVASDDPTINTFQAMVYDTKQSKDAQQPELKAAFQIIIKPLG